MLGTWRQRAGDIRRDTYALYLACRDPRVPWYAKSLAVAVLAYALSPVDLIPDFIPIFGYLDDLILIPAGIAMVVRMIPPGIMAEYRAAATDGRAPRSRLGLVLVAAAWIAAVALIGWVTSRYVL